MEVAIRRVPAVGRFKEKVPAEEHVLNVRARARRKSHRSLTVILNKIWAETWQRSATQKTLPQPSQPQRPVLQAQLTQRCRII
jgi:hypothetical protein